MLNHLVKWHNTTNMQWAVDYTATKKINAPYLHWRELWRCHPTPSWWRWGRWRSAGTGCLSWADAPQSPAHSGVCSILACRGPRLDRAHPKPPAPNNNFIDMLLTFSRWMSIDVVIKNMLTSSRSKRMNSSPDTSVRKSVRWSWLQTSAFLPVNEIS